MTIKEFLGVKKPIEARPKTRSKRKAVEEILELLRESSSQESFAEAQRFAMLDITTWTDAQVAKMFDQLKATVKTLK